MTNNLKHIGFIMDGNRRWAKEKGLPSLMGHKKGYQMAMKVVEWCIKKGIKIITLNTFSTENWNRKKEEVNYLMNLTKSVFKKDINKLHKNGIKIQFLGRINELAKDLQQIFNQAMTLTKNNSRGILNIAFNYGGQAEIIDAINNLIKAGVKKVTPEIFQKYLYDPTLLPLDLIVRTSGEMRTSGFLLWESAYSELYFTKTYWPAFTEKDLNKAIAEYNKRQRRFGG